MIDSDRVVRSPRFSERRRAVRAERRRMRLRLLVGLLTVLALIAGGWALSRSPLFAIESVSVVGAKGLDPDVVRRASGLRVGEPGLRVDLDGAARGVRTLPGVEGVTVSREDSLRFRIVVTMRTPAIVLRGGSSDRVFDREGVLLATPKKLRALPVLESDRPDAIDALDDVLGLWASASRRQRASVRRFRLTADGVVADLQQGSVTFGDGSGAAAKVEAWRLVSKRVRDDGRRLISVDVRAPERPAVRVA